MNQVIQEFRFEIGVFFVFQGPMMGNYYHKLEEKKRINFIIIRIGRVRGILELLCLAGRLVFERQLVVKTRN